MDPTVAFTPPADRVPTTAQHNLRSVTAMRSAASTLARSNAPTSVLALRRLPHPRTWLTEYLHACADAGGRVPEDFQRFLPWNRREARVPRASPAKVVDSRAA